MSQTVNWKRQRVSRLLWVYKVLAVESQQHEASLLEYCSY
jgi:hypothetical protein